MLANKINWIDDPICFIGFWFQVNEIGEDRWDRDGKWNWYFCVRAVGKTNQLEVVGRKTWSNSAENDPEYFEQKVASPRIMRHSRHHDHMCRFRPEPEMRPDCEFESPCLNRDGGVVLDPIRVSSGLLKLWRRKCSEEALGDVIRSKITGVRNE